MESVPRCHSWNHRRLTVPAASTWAALSFIPASESVCGAGQKPWQRTSCCFMAPVGCPGDSAHTFLTVTWWACACRGALSHSLMSSSRGTSQVVSRSFKESDMPRTIWFHSYEECKTESNKGTSKTDKNWQAQALVWWVPEGRGKAEKGKEGQVHGHGRRFDFGW